MHPRLRHLLVPGLLVVLLAAACGSSSGSSSSPGAGGKAAPPFTTVTLSGAEFDSASFAGKDTVLWFWAPWCTICRGEGPDVVASAAALNGSVEVIGVAGRGAVPEMKGFVTDTGTDGLTHVVDADGKIWSAYGVFAQPAYAFIDDSGSVEVVVGALGEKALTERMTTLARS